MTERYLRADRNVICGVSNRGDAAQVAIASDFARAVGARLTLLRCLPPLRLKLGDGKSAQRDRAHSHAKSTIEALASELEERRPTSVVVDLRKPAEGLRSAAARPGTIALVLGSGRGQALGDVAAEVAATAAVPVAIVPRGSPRLPAARTVIAGYDGAPASRAAIDSIAQVLPERTRTLLGTVLPTTSSGAGRADVDLSRGVELRCLRGHPGEALRELAESTDADMVAVGANSRDGGREPLLGSTVRHLCRTVRRPVLVASPRVADRQAAH